MISNRGMKEVNMQHNLSVVVINHGEFGKWLIKSAELIVGRIEDIHHLSLLEGMSLESLLNLGNEVLEGIKGEVIILTDMYGGTPNAAALHFQRSYKCKVICGANLPMLLDLLINRDRSDMSLEEITQSCIHAGKESIIDCVLANE